MPTDTDAAIYGQGCNTRKASGYAPHPYFPKVFNTHNCIDKDMHSRKRRIVSQAFSETAIASSERYIIDHVRSFCDGLLVSASDKGWSEPVDMALWSKSALEVGCGHLLISRFSELLHP